MDGAQTGGSETGARQHSPRVTVFNLTGREVGCIVDGCMYAVPAGQAGGGRGTLVVSEQIARRLLAECPGELSLRAADYREGDVAAMRAMELEELRDWTEGLMRGHEQTLAEFRAQRAAAAMTGTDRPATAGRPAARQESAVRP